MSNSVLCGRLLAHLARRQGLLLNMTPLDEKAAATKWHRLDELRQVIEACGLQDYFTANSEVGSQPNE